MLQKDATTWSKDRVREEINDRRARIRQMEEALESHREDYARNPDAGFQGNDLYSFISRYQGEIQELMQLF